MKKNVELLKEWPLREGVYCFPVPDNAVGEYRLGFVTRRDDAFDAMDFWGLRLTADAGTLTVTAHFADREPLQTELTFCVPGTLELPLDAFPIETARRDVWQFVTGFSFGGTVVRRAVLRRAKTLAVECAVRGKSAPAGQAVTYTALVANCTDTPLEVRPRQVYEGWESMNAAITPESVTLEPGQEAEFTISLTVSPQLCSGMHETTRIRFCGDGPELTLHTLCALPHPTIYHDAAGWRRVWDNIEKDDRFRAVYEGWRQTAEQWQPEPAAEGADYCYFTDTETSVMCAAYCYALTGEEQFAQKLVRFFRYFAQSYPRRLRGCHQSYVQEGHFFQHLAIPYDIVYHSPLLTAADHAAIEHCFRLYMAMLDKDIRNGHISNWVLSEVTGAVYCALAMQDWAAVERFVFGPSGTVQQLCCGAFSDGWWHEGSIGYNTWVSSMFLHTAHALRPFGVDLVYADFPLNASLEVRSTYAARPVEVPFAMVNRKWGGTQRPSLHIKDLFDAVVPFLDWRGVMFGVNDSDEKTIDGVHFGSTYELAYHYYRDPAYLPIIRSFAEPDVVFGTPDLPPADNIASSRCAVSDNIGLALLRSQTPGRSQREQIQAVLHYGNHGGAHGHFDIGDLLSVMRCGRSLFNPECSWWGYRHFMYKWHVQNSLTKNMVNVDDKMQLPADSRRILFYSGQRLQAAGVEVSTRWAYPPYGGMDYDDSPGDFVKRLHMNNAWFPINPSLCYAQISGETEPVFQRRLLAVTDDYLVLFDYAAGQEPHQYETTFQFKGLRALENVTPTKHTDQYTTDPASDGQMITDCQWYEGQGTVTARFLNRFGAGVVRGDPNCTESALCGDRSYHNEPGELHMDVYAAWPPAPTVVTGLMATYIGWPADKDGYNIPLQWRVLTDGETAAQGAFDAWILGRGEADIPLNGVTTLTLCATQGNVTNEKGQPVRTPPALFWGDTVLTLADGSARRLCELPYTARNVLPSQGIGRDYEGGRVLVMGRELPDALPASTIDHTAEGRLEFDLTSLDAVRLQLCIGADPYPGSEDQRRRFLAFRAPDAPAARFITVLEPYESLRMVQKVTAEGPDAVTVTLTDGRVQTIRVQNMETSVPSMTLSERDFRESTSKS